MQVKTFTGPDSQTVLAQIKIDMGPDAVILSSRDVHKDGQHWYEITAGVDRVADGSGGPPQAWDEWHKEWDKVKEHLYALMQPSLQWERLTPRHRVALEYLQKEGVDDSVIVDLYQKMLSAPGASVLEALSELVVTRPWSARVWPEHLHIMAGPSGSGKTTAALRMALLLRQERPEIRIAFINADCERGNGRLLLRHWAELSGFAYAEAPDAETMHAALRAGKDVTHLFVDLPALRDGATLADMMTSMGLQATDAAVHLALPPHYSTTQNRAFLNRYQTSLLSDVVWTKLDEAAGFGPLINVASFSGLPVSALSYGSAMRGTLSPAEEAFLWRLIFKRQLPGRITEPEPAPDVSSGNAVRSQERTHATTA